MRKQPIEITDYANTITAALRRGVLLTTKNGEKVADIRPNMRICYPAWYSVIFAAAR